MASAPHIPFRVAVVGSGPAGCYVAEHLLDAGTPIEVDLFERLPAPYGLLRYGVAPDQPKIREIAKRFDRFAEQEAFRLFTNVCVGKDIALKELQAHYDAVVITTGASSDRQMGIAGDSLPGCHGSMEFVGWYNGHPDFKGKAFDLDIERAVIIGNGNVALDVARMLAHSARELDALDMPDYAREALAASRLSEVVIVGRRGPAQVSFSAQELKMLSSLGDAGIVIDDAELVLNEQSRQELDVQANRHRKRAYDVLRSFKGARGSVRVRMTFLQSPVEVLGDGRVEGIRLGRNRLVGVAGDQQAESTGTLHDLSCGLILSCIGYDMDDALGMPTQDGHIANEHGRVSGFQRVYVSGWAKTGPRGLIGGTKADAAHIVPLILADLQERGPRQGRGQGAVEQLLKEKGIRSATVR